MGPDKNLTQNENNFFHYKKMHQQIDGLVQEKCNSSANALELHLSCINPLKCHLQDTSLFVQASMYYHFLALLYLSRAQH